jgi:hypothetical protein
MPCNISQTLLRDYVDCLLLSGDKVYICIENTLYVYPVSNPRRRICTYQLDDYIYSAEIIGNRLYLGSHCKLFIFEATHSLKKPLKNVA